MNNRWIYDLECYPNFFSCCAIREESDEIVKFVISPFRDDRIALMKWLNNDVNSLVGFNNISYDYPLLHVILTNKSYFLSNTINRVNEWIYRNSDRIINEEYSAIRKRDVLIYQYDLFRIYHYNNKARMCSLKHLEFFMRWENLQDLPIKPGEYVKKEDLNLMIEYNINDILATKKFWEFAKGEGKVQQRKDLSDLYEKDFSNHNDVKIGSDIVLMLYCKKTGKNPWDVSKLSTHYDRININDIIFPYLKFQRAEFNAIKYFFSTKILTSIEGSMTDISKYQAGDVWKYSSNKKKFKDTKKDILKKLNIEIDGLPYVYGSGGLHASRVGVFEEDDNYVIIDADIASMYPNILIKNNLYPTHLGKEFLEVYENDIVKARLAAKRRWNGGSNNQMDKTLSDGLKLAANGTYGKLGDEYSFLRDLKVLLSVTINGQLLLSMLLDMLISRIGDMTVLQANTDGITVKIHKNSVEHYYSICKEWESITELELEYAYYSKMCLRDCNNYIAIYTDGKVKYKGEYEIDSEPHKNHSQRIVAIAAARYFISGVEPSKTIKEHHNYSEYPDVPIGKYKKPAKAYGIYDFCREAKASTSPKKGRSQFQFMYLKDGVTIRENLQKINRYFVSKSGGRLLKCYSDGSEAKEPAGKIYTTVMNQYKDYDNSFVDHTFYIKETRKLINNIENKNKKNRMQYSLF